MKKILLYTIASAALCGPVLAHAEAPQDLRNHTQVEEPLIDNMGSAKTQHAQYIENYLTKKKWLERVEEEFGLEGLDTVRRAYAAKINAPLWTVDGVLDLQRSSEDVLEHGIIATDIFSKDLDKLILKRFNSKSLKKQAKADIDLTLIWLRLAQAMSGDLSEERGMSVIKGMPTLRYSLPKALLSSAKGSSERELLNMAPQAPQYLRLKAALEQYRTFRRNGGWLAIRDGDAIELGDKDKRVPKLRTRLRAEGYEFEALANTEDNELFDEALSHALKKFQSRHGLEQDGVLGGNTLEALNESVSSKIDRIAESMFRWRAQGDLGDRYIWANIPSFSAEGWNDGQLEIKQKTIVGKERFATPEFSDEVEFMVANPKWYLPVSIVRRQKVPKLKKDPSYAAKYGYKIFDRKSGEQVNAFDVDWTEPGVSRQYRFIQEAGDGNALGAMKIIFPNQYSVYLHGTPGKHLFDRAERAFSSGCVRLENPVAMAKWIARHDEGAQVETIKVAMATEENTRLNLEDNVPVHITYFTVTVDENGAPHFWRDIYDRYDGGIRYVERYERKQDKRRIALLNMPFNDMSPLKTTK